MDAEHEVQESWSAPVQAKGELHVHCLVIIKVFSLYNRFLAATGSNTRRIAEDSEYSATLSAFFQFLDLFLRLEAAAGSNNGFLGGGHFSATFFFSLLFFC